MEYRGSRVVLYLMLSWILPLIASIPNRRSRYAMTSRNAHWASRVPGPIRVAVSRAIATDIRQKQEGEPRSQTSLTGLEDPKLVVTQSAPLAQSLFTLGIHQSR